MNENTFVYGIDRLESYNKLSNRYKDFKRFNNSIRNNKGNFYKLSAVADAHGISLENLQIENRDESIIQRVYINTMETAHNLIQEGLNVLTEVGSDANQDFFKTHLAEQLNKIRSNVADQEIHIMAYENLPPQGKDFVTKAIHEKYGVMANPDFLIELGKRLKNNVPAYVVYNQLGLKSQLFKQIYSKSTEFKGELINAINKSDVDTHLVLINDFISILFKDDDPDVVYGRLRGWLGRYKFVANTHKTLFDKYNESKVASDAFDYIDVDVNQALSLIENLNEYVVPTNTVRTQIGAITLLIERLEDDLVETKLPNPEFATDDFLRETNAFYEDLLGAFIECVRRYLIFIQILKGQQEVFSCAKNCMDEIQKVHAELIQLWSEAGQLGDVKEEQSIALESLELTPVDVQPALPDALVTFQRNSTFLGKKSDEITKLADKQVVLNEVYPRLLKLTGASTMDFEEGMLEKYFRSDFLHKATVVNPGKLSSVLVTSNGNTVIGRILSNLDFIIPALNDIANKINVRDYIYPVKDMIDFVNELTIRLGIMVDNNNGNAIVDKSIVETVYDYTRARDNVEITFQDISRFISSQARYVHDLANLTNIVNMIADIQKDADTIEAETNAYMVEHSETLSIDTFYNLTTMVGIAINETKAILEQAIKTGNEFIDCFDIFVDKAINKR